MKADWYGTKTLQAGDTCLLPHATSWCETTPDLNKPANLFKGNISTHSMRAGATQRMLKPEWIDIRCGREKKAKSKTAYISREWEGGYPCDLVLAWDRIDISGLCLTISAIPPQTLSIL